MYSFSLSFSSEKKLTLAVFHSNQFSPNSNQNLNIRLTDSEFRLICSGQRMVKSRIYQGPYLICQANHIYRYTLGDQSLLILGSDCEISNGLCSGGKLFRTLIFFFQFINPDALQPACLNQTSRKVSCSIPAFILFFSPLKNVKEKKYCSIFWDINDEYRQSLIYVCLFLNLEFRMEAGEVQVTYICPVLTTFLSPVLCKQLQLLLGLL